MTTCIGGPLHGQQVEHETKVMHVHADGENSRIVAYCRSTFRVHDECYHFYVFNELTNAEAEKLTFDYLAGTQPTVDKTT